MDVVLRRPLATTLLLGALLAARMASAQTFGVELHNTLMPAAGGMGGVSIAQPQDLTSAINANPAALTQLPVTMPTPPGPLAVPDRGTTVTVTVFIARPATLVAVSVGALSKPGVETGIGSASRPLPSPLSASPVITTCWHAADSTTRGGMGFASARSQRACTSSGVAFMPRQ